MTNGEKERNMGDSWLIIYSDGTTETVYGTYDLVDVVYRSDQSKGIRAIINLG